MKKIRTCPETPEVPDRYDTEILMSTHTILLVDDDADMRMMTERWLRKDGYTVIAAGSGREALDSLQGFRPDLVLLDYNMPDLDGIGTLTEIRNHPATRDLPVFFLTGMEDEGSRETAEKLNPQGYLQKSLGKKGLLAALSAYFT